MSVYCPLYVTVKRFDRTVRDYETEHPLAPSIETRSGTVLSIWQIAACLSVCFLSLMATHGGDDGPQ